MAATPLREFVYLDEVSVYSLIASRTGAIETDYRDTNSTLLRSELQSTAGVHAGVAKGDASSAVEASQTSEVQVVRKAIIQSTFRQLYGMERHRLAMSTGADDPAGVRPRSVSELRAVIADRDRHGAAIVDPLTLRRGQVVEVEVELQAHQVFGLSTAVAAVMEIIEGTSVLSSTIDRNEMRHVVEINQMLRRLLVGLVPLEGRAVNYRAVTVDGKEWLVRERLVADLPEGDVDVREVVVAGVAEQQLFWKDLRRILFSRSRYLVMARLGRDGLQDAWNPVKSLTVLEQMAPALAEPLREGIQSLPTIMQMPDDDGSNQFTIETNKLYLVLVKYGVALVEHSGGQYSDPAEDLLASGAIDLATITAPSAVEARRAAFAAVERRVRERFGLELDARWGAEMRERLQKEAGIWPPLERGSTLEVAGEAEEAGTATKLPERGTERYLDAEIIAVYW